eukprot:6727105-Prymnesium_polylepis.2
MSSLWVAHLPPPPPRCAACGLAPGDGSGLLKAIRRNGELMLTYECCCGADSILIHTAPVTASLCIDMLRGMSLSRACPGDHDEQMRQLKMLSDDLAVKNQALQLRLCGLQPQSVIVGNLPYEVVKYLLRDIAADDAFCSALTCKLFYAVMCETWKGSPRRFTTSLTGLGVSRLEWALALGLPSSEICEVAAYRGELELLKEAHALGCPFNDATIAATRFMGPGRERLYTWLKEAGAPTSEATDVAISYRGRFHDPYLRFPPTFRDQPRVHRIGKPPVRPTGAGYRVPAGAAVSKRIRTGARDTAAESRDPCWLSPRHIRCLSARHSRDPTLTITSMTRTPRRARAHCRRTHRAAYR